MYVGVIVLGPCFVVCSCVLSSLAMKRAGMLLLCCGCLCSVSLLTVLWVGLQSMVVVFLGHIHILFFVLNISLCMESNSI